MLLLTALGFYVADSFGSIFTARTDKVFRQNAIVMLYQLILHSYSWSRVFRRA